MKKTNYFLLTITLVAIAIIATYLTTNSIHCSQKTERACVDSPQCTAVYIQEAENEEFNGGPFGSLLPYGYPEKPVHCRDLQLGRLENFVKNK